jgi:hypothetical protein
MAIASSLTDPFYPDVEAFAARLWQDGNQIKLFPFDGPGSDYLTDELADLTIRCLNYIDSANILNGTADIKNQACRSVLKVLGSGSNIRIGISAVPGEQLTIQLIDCIGQSIYPVYRGQMIGQDMELPVCQGNSLKSGLYLIRSTGSESGTSGTKILVNKN